MKRQQGFSLLEVLVTMLIMSIGLLGIAGIIVTSLRNYQSSYARGQASIMANDIIDRMRANRGTAEKANSPYALALTASPGVSSSIPDADLREWRTQLAQSLPAGTGAVSFNSAFKVTVTVQWDDSRASGDGSKFGLSAQQLVVETQL